MKLQLIHGIALEMKRGPFEQKRKPKAFRSSTFCRKRHIFFGSSAKGKNLMKIKTAFSKTVFRQMHTEKL